MKFIAPLLYLLSLLVASQPAVASTNEEGQHGGLRRDLNGHAHYSHKVTVKVTNLAPQFGTCQSPVWVAIHDGRFDMFNQGSRASEGIEAMAEDGNPEFLSDQFQVTRGTIWENNVATARICSGEVVTLVDYLNIPTGTPFFFSYATMVLPSNDAFLANASPRAYKITNSNARPIQSVVTIIDHGSEVWDAGTEVNDEIARNTGGLQPIVPGAGVTEYFKIIPHRGFNARGTGGILDRDAYRNADFTQPGYRMMKIEVYVERRSGTMVHAAMDLP